MVIPGDVVTAGIVRTGRPLAGMACAMVSVACFGLYGILAQIAYAHGNTPMTVTVGRAAIVAAMLGIAALPHPGRLRLVREDWHDCLIFAAGTVGTSLLYLSSLRFIPVGLATLILYLFPLMVAVLRPLLAGSRIDPMTVLLLLVAFAGMAIALGSAAMQLNWQGGALALAAACSAALTFLMNEPLLVRNTISATAFWSNVLGFVLLLPVAALSGMPAVLPVRPDALAGWLGLAAVSLAYFVGFLAQSVSVRALGPIWTAATFNLEPVLTMGLSATMLGEAVTGLEICGAAVVIMSLMVQGGLSALGPPGRRSSP